MKDANLLLPEKEVYGIKHTFLSTVTECCYPDISDLSSTASMGDPQRTDATASGICKEGEIHP